MTEYEIAPHRVCVIGTVVTVNSLCSNSIAGAYVLVDFVPIAAAGTIFTKLVSLHGLLTVSKSGGSV